MPFAALISSISISGEIPYSRTMPMMSVFGSDGQEFLLWAHRIVALVFVAVSVVLCAVAIWKRR